MERVPLLWRMGEQREDTAIRRFLSRHFHDFLHAAGIPPLGMGERRAWGVGWCALNLPRRFVFQDDMDGDVDILAGPLEPAFGADDLMAHERELADRLGADAHPSWAMNLAFDDLLARRGVVWPPTDQTIVAVEAKASWFSPEAHDAAQAGRAHAPQNGWKATHLGEHKRVLGQLEVLAAKGIDAVSFLHLAATKPREHLAANPWFIASDDAAVATDCMKRVFDPAGTPFGYFVSVSGAVPHKTEERAGAGGELQVRQLPARVDGARGVWREAFWKSLSTLPPPRSRSPIIGMGPDGRLTWEAQIAHALTKPRSPGGR